MNLYLGELVSYLIHFGESRAIWRFTILIFMCLGWNGTSLTMGFVHVGQDPH